MATGAVELAGKQASEICATTGKCVGASAEWIKEHPMEAAMGGLAVAGMIVAAPEVLAVTGLSATVGATVSALVASESAGAIVATGAAYMGGALAVLETGKAASEVISGGEMAILWNKENQSPEDIQTAQQKLKEHTAGAILTDALAVTGLKLAGDAAHAAEEAAVLSEGGEFLATLGEHFPKLGKVAEHVKEGADKIYETSKHVSEAAGKSGFGQATASFGQDISTLAENASKLRPNLAESKIGQQFKQISEEAGKIAEKIENTNIGKAYKAAEKQVEKVGEEIEKIGEKIEDSAIYKEFEAIHHHHGFFDKVTEAPTKLSEVKKDVPDESHKEY